MKNLPEGKGKKTMLFCTYAIRAGGALKILEKELLQKGYVNLLSISKRVLKVGKFDAPEVLAAVQKAVEKQQR